MHVGGNLYFFGFILVLSVTPALSGCGLEASITDMNQVSINEAQRIEPDFVASEVVTTNQGVVVRGAFGEISEKKTLSNNVVIEGAFYE